MSFFNNSSQDEQEKSANKTIFGIICVTVLFFILVQQKDSPLAASLILMPEAIRDLQLWRIVSSLLVNISGWNLFFEMFALYIFGTIITPRIGGMKILSLYPSGRVEKLQINEEVITGKSARKVFGLDSAMFTVEITDRQVIFHTKGFGHGVGMSQAGANGMATDGANYKTILTHYYTGVSIGVIGQF